LRQAGRLPARTTGRHAEVRRMGTAAVRSPRSADPTTGPADGQGTHSDHDVLVPATHRERRTTDLGGAVPGGDARADRTPGRWLRPRARVQDRKSTRLNSSHVKISYAVFCLKKKNM